MDDWNTKMDQAMAAVRESPEQRLYQQFIELLSCAYEASKERIVNAHDEDEIIYHQTRAVCLRDLMNDLEISR